VSAFFAEIDDCRVPTVYGDGPRSDRPAAGVRVLGKPKQHRDHVHVWTNAIAFVPVVEFFLPARGDRTEQTRKDSHQSVRVQCKDQRSTKDCLIAWRGPRKMQVDATELRSSVRNMFQLSRVASAFGAMRLASALVERAAWGGSSST